MKRIRFAFLRVILMVPMVLGAISARVGLSALFTSIAGRYGGGVFRNWKGVNVLAVLPDSVANPQTADQVKARGLLTCTTKHWAGLAIAVKDAWGTVSVYLSDQWGNYTNEVGTHTVIRTPRGPYTSLGAMVSVHALLGSCDAWDCETIPVTAPAGVTAPAQPMNLAASGDDAGVVLVWDAPGTWGVSGTVGFVRIWAKSENGTFFAQMNGFVAGAIETYTITELTPVGGGAPIPIKTGLYFLQVDAVNGNGLRSAPSAVVRFDVTVHVP